MTAQMFEVDDLAPIERRGSGVRSSGDALLTYDVTVFAGDLERAVGAAGGWLCDRVRAGWRVTVLVPPGSDVRALTILGVGAAEWESGVDALRRLRPAALAVDACVLRDDERLRREVLRIVDDGSAEVTVWGESGLFAADRRFSRVRHRLSAAARAFKARALPPSPVVEGADRGIEEFVSSALWYSPEGGDLVPIRPISDAD